MRSGLQGDARDSANHADPYRILLTQKNISISKPSPRLAELNSEACESGLDGSGPTGRGLDEIYAQSGTLLLSGSVLLPKPESLLI